MRISNRIAGAGSNGLTRIPFLDITSIDADLCGPDGRLDEAKCRRVLNHPDDGIQLNSDDGIPEFAFALELLKQTRDAVTKMIANRRDGNNCDAHDAADCADDRHAERNMSRGRFVIVRTDITYKAGVGKDGGIRLCIDIGNPKGVVGVAWNIAHDYALILARIANNIADQMVAAHGKWGYEFVGGPGCPSLFDDARRIEDDLKRKSEVKEANVMMWKCERRTASGHCSPCKFDCPHCRGGKCVEIEIDGGVS